jgi:hypothetical protein
MRSRNWGIPDSSYPFEIRLHKILPAAAPNKFTDYSGRGPQFLESKTSNDERTAVGSERASGTGSTRPTGAVYKEAEVGV